MKYTIGKKGKHYIFIKKLSEYYLKLGGEHSIISKSRKCDSIPKKCIFLWSVESPIYHELAGILECDDYTQLKSYMSFIRCVNLFINNHPINKDIKTYRCSHMEVTQAKLLQCGQLYRISKYLPTSTKFETASKFKSKFMIELNIPKYCPNAAYIHKYSRFPNEEEI